MVRHTAFHAADRKPLTAQSLAPVPPEEAATLTFKLHPSVGLIASPYPIVSVWETNAYDAEVRAIGPAFRARQRLPSAPSWK